MANTVDDQLEPRHGRGLFGERYPDYLSWLDGQTWELDVETEIHEPVGNFRASLHYQAREMGMKVATRTVWREEDGQRRRKFQMRGF
jgi:Ser/Thr protein kinase RdoA (MazF antagonist)